MRVFVVLALTLALVGPVAMGQKPPAPKPPPPPPSTPPSRSPGGALSSSDLTQPKLDYVLFLMGRVAANDGTQLPIDTMVERVCNNKVRQQVHATSRGDFSMQLGARTDSIVDASGEPSLQPGVGGKDMSMGISRQELRNCEIRASVAGFYTAIVNLETLDTFGGRIDVGNIVLQRSTKIEGMTVSAGPYKAPKDARRAYEKGMGAEKKGNLASARKNFEMAVEIYPKYASAWFALGNVLQKEEQKDAARKAFTQATISDKRFLPPYMSLATMAYEEKDWTALLTLTDFILEHDPLKLAGVTGYIIDLDDINGSEAYFYNAVANFRLNKMEAAEKSALKAEQMGLLVHLPQVHLLLGEIFARRNDYANAITEVQTYLELLPNAKNAEQVREQLAKLEKLNEAESAAEKRER